MKLRRACAILTFAAIAALPQLALAATLFVAPASGIREVGKTFTVNLDVTSSDKALNAVDVVVGFPSAKLEAVAVSKSGSILSYWLEEPTISNADGTIRMQGIVPNPGWSGTAGRVASVTFRVKTDGTAAVKILSGSVLANDGQGTDILSGFGNASFSLVVPGHVPAVTPPAPSASTSSTPPTPIEQVATTTAPTPAPVIVYTAGASANDYQFLLAMFFLPALLILFAPLVLYYLHTRRREEIRKRRATLHEAFKHAETLLRSAHTQDALLKAVRAAERAVEDAIKDVEKKLR